jgi:hypothetical protein
VSTALMYSFAQRADTRVVDEPLYGHYLRVSGVRHPGRDEILASMDTDGGSVMRHLAAAAYDRPVLFAKQMAHHWLSMDARLLADFDHFFLIRDPRQMLPSLAKVLNTVDLEATGLPSQVRLLDEVQSRGLEFFCIDSGDLLKSPAGLLSAACRRLQLDFDPGMTHWQPGPRPEDGVWAPWWYARVHRSRGFEPYRPATDPVPEQLLGLLDECQKLYSRLREFAIHD